MKAGPAMPGLRRAAGVAVIALGLAPAAAVAARTDVLVLKNGDRITGEVKKLGGGRLEFKTDKVGTIQVQWDAVARLTSTLFFEVILVDARRLYGELQTPDADGMLRVGTGTTALDVPLTDIAQIDRLRRSFWRRIKGSVDLGVSFTKADSKTEWNVAAQTSYRTPKRKLALSVDSLFRRSDTDDFDREDLTLSFQRFYGGRWLSGAFGSWQRNSELALDLRLLAGGAAGLHLVRTVEQDLIAAVGIAFSSEDFTDERGSTESVEALLAFDYNLYALGGREFTVTAGLSVFPSLSVWGRVRLEARLDLRRELFKDFYLSVSFFDSFDSRSEGSASPQNDLGVTTSIGWTF